MTIELEGVAKRYRLEWVFRRVDLQFRAGERYAVAGPNGSGKSTLLKILSGHLSPSRGRRHYRMEGREIPPAGIYRHLSLAAPYIELVEEMTLHEAVNFHQKFKALREGLSPTDLTHILNLPRALNKPIRNFSSGMKQRLKLALAICTQADLLLLDEPGTNLDEEGIRWYRGLIAEFTTDTTLIIASNAEADYDFCPHRIDITDFK